MTIFQSLLYGVVSGLSEIFPISMQAHQSLMLQVFGISQRNLLSDLLVHIAILLAVYTACNSSVNRLLADRRRLNASGRHRSQMRSERGYYELKLLSSATPLMLAGLLVYFAADSLESKLASMALFFLLNGIVLFLPDHLRSGNKDARSMASVDSLFVGIGAALSALPGISRTGVFLSTYQVRGADRQNALSWSLLLTIPAMLFLCGYDIISIFINGFGTFTFLSFLGSIISAAGAFCGGYLGIAVMRYLTVRVGYSGFAYYSWGASLFAFILYLIT